MNSFRLISQHFKDNRKDDVKEFTSKSPILSISKGKTAGHTSMLYVKKESYTRNFVKGRNTPARVITQKEELLKKLSNLGLLFSSQLSD